jgi:ABC-type sulfate transport system permease component
MQPEELQLDQAVLRLNANLLGMVVGALFGFLLLLATVVLVVKGGPNAGLHLALLSNFFPGYRVTLGGSLLGLVYGFALGFVCGYLLGAIYNKLVSA